MPLSHSSDDLILADALDVLRYEISWAIPDDISQAFVPGATEQLRAEGARLLALLREQYTDDALTALARLGNRTALEHLAQDFVRTHCPAPNRRLLT